MNSEEREKMTEIGTKLDMFMSGTEVYRHELSAAIKELQDKVNSLPCDSRKVINESLCGQLRMVWGVLTLMLAAVITGFFKR